MKMKYFRHYRGNYEAEFAFNNNVIGVMRVDIPKRTLLMRVGSGTSRFIELAPDGLREGLAIIDALERGEVVE